MRNYFSKSLSIFLLSGFFIFFGNTNTVEAQYRSKSKIYKAKKKAHTPYNGRVSKRSSIRSRNYRSSRASRHSSRSSRYGYGRSYRYAPSLSSKIKYGNHNYRYHKGLYYRPYNNNYQVVHPPIGITVNSLPSTRYKFNHRGHDYFYSHGGFYSSVGNKYQVVQAPIGARFPQLPTDASRFTWNSNVYYASDRAFFMKTYDEYGKVVYEVVEM